MTDQQEQGKSTEQEGSAYWVSTQSGQRIPINFTFDYKGVRHVSNIVQCPDGPDAFAAQVMEKYRRIAAGLDPVTGEPKAAAPVSPKRELRSAVNGDLGPRDQDLRRTDSRAEIEAEVARLRTEVERLKAGEPDAETARLLTEQAELEKELAALQLKDAGNGNGAYKAPNGAEPKAEPAEKPARPKRPNRSTVN